MAATKKKPSGPVEATGKTGKTSAKSAGKQSAKVARGASDGPRRAAFFDLDRTLLAGGSAPVFAEALRTLGVATPRIPGQDAILKLYDIVGETKAGMQVARSAVAKAAGLRRDDVRRAAGGAVDELLQRLQPYVSTVIAEHRAAGDLLVLATTSPYDLVAPFASALGFDAVVATQYTEQEGTYTGDIDGTFVWGPGKLAAVQEWAQANNVSMPDSAAYSDSYFDAPLLGAVGRPTAVNPDVRLLALSALKGWPVRWFDAPSGVPRLFGVEPLDVLRRVIRPEFIPYARFSFEGVANIPTEGPVIIAANHRSYFDPLALALLLARAGRNGRFLAKQEVVKAPVVGQVVKAFGTISVDRGSGSDQPLNIAAEALAAGEAIVILPQGTIPRGEAFFDPQLVGRPGVARLAAMTGAPVVPVGLWGTDKVWPRNAKIPNMTNVVSPPLVVAKAGKPVKLKSSAKSARTDTEAVMAAISALLPAESRKKRSATAEELRSTMPS
jgi:putative phosphoserine phosphatase / 1-acylglycerol-3-phosphate O-acyltransferase